MSQLIWVKDQLETKGYVSRNEALDRRITRLGAIVWELQHHYGYHLEGRWDRTSYKNDYIYLKKNRTFQTAKEANEFIRSLNVG